MNAQITSVSDARDAAVVQANSLQADLDAATAEVARLEGDVTAKQADLDAAKADVAALQSELASNNELVTSLNDQLDTAAAEMVALEGQLSDAQIALAEEQAAHAATKAQLDAATANVGDLQSQLAASQVDNADLTADLAQAQEDLAALQTSYTTSQARLEAANTRVTSLEGQLATANQSIGSLQSDLSTANARIADLEDQLGNGVTIIDGLRADLAAANARVADLETQLADANATIADLNGQLATLQAERDAYVAERDQLQADLDAANVAFATYSETAYNARQDKTEYKNTLTTGADTVAAAAAAVQSAQDAADLAQSALDDAMDNPPNPDYVGQTLATWLAVDNQRAAATKYAALVGWDITSDADQNKIIDTNDYNDAVTQLTSGRDAADQDLTVAQATLDSTNSANLAGYGGIEHGEALTLYDAAGNALAASGAAVYQAERKGENAGDQVPVVARVTSLFLLDENGDPEKMLVFTATSDLPYSLQQPVGAVSFVSDDMVAFFAQKEGENIYVLSGPVDDAGLLTLNFDDQSGVLTVNGIANNANLDYSITANLTFDPETGEFTGTGDQVQAYTTSSGGAETATALVSGQLHGAAEAFTASIKATDTTDLGSIPVEILTSIAGNGSLQ